MHEQVLIRKQLIKNMVYTFMVFAILLLFLDLLIYNQVKASLYKSIDNELLMSSNRYQIIEEPKILMQYGVQGMGSEIRVEKSNMNPRLIHILRDSSGEITNATSIGRFYEDYLSDFSFDKSNIGKIYSIKVSNEYNYRGVTFKLYNEIGETIYLQVLANVDGEAETIDSLSRTLIVGTGIVIAISVIASYILSRRTLKPILDSWRKQTEFVQNAAHELRTPLTIIQAKQQLLLQEPESKIIDKSEDISLTIKETRRLTKLIKELMVLASADSNELELKKELTKLDELIKEVSIPYVDFANTQNKKISLDLNSSKEINIDRSKISQLMVIVLDNAIKYTSENDKITVKTYEKDGRTYIEVIDTGIGISKESIKYIFDRFYREDKARTRETGGTGLGLSIAYTIVKAHGGTIKAVSNEPKGTKIIIKI